MTTITENEFARICEDLREDREKIIRYNPIGTPEEIMLWMLLGVLVSYLSLTETETPCFTGTPDAGTYRQAVLFVLNGRAAGGFDPNPHIDKLVA